MTERGENITWSGNLSVNPVGSRGRLAITKIELDRLSSIPGADGFPVTGGTIDIDAPYDLAFDPFGFRIRVADGRIEVRDAALGLAGREPSVLTPLRLSLAPIQLDLSRQGRSGTPDLTLSLNTGINGSGRATLRGTLPNKGGGRLDIALERVALPPFQTFANAAAALRIDQGTLSATATLKLPDAGGAGFVLDGRASLDGLRASDRALGEDLVQLERLGVDGLHYDAAGRALTVSTIHLAKPVMTIALDAKRGTNLQRVALAPAPSGPTQAAPEPTATMASEKPIDIRIGALRIAHGALRFRDQSLSPAVDTGLLDIQATLRDLATKPTRPARIDLKAKVHRSAPLTVTGSLNPLAAFNDTDVSARIAGFDMAPLGPYAMKYVGDKLLRGTLGFSLKCQVVNRTLDAENNLIVDQLTLGDRVESKEATTLPVSLGISLLKDLNGVINVDLPISGSLDDPDFRYGRAVWRVLGNLFAKAATAPFTLLLKSVGVGGGDVDFDTLTFTPGEADLSEADQARLDQIAEALGTRPGATLTIRGVASPAVDRQQIAEQLIERRVSGEDTSAHVIALYRETFHEDPNLLVPKEVPAESRPARVEAAARTRLVREASVTAEDYGALAVRRVEAIRSRLAGKGVAPDRVIIGDADVAAPASGGLVRTKLVLGTR